MDTITVTEGSSSSACGLQRTLDHKTQGALLASADTAARISFADDSVLQHGDNLGFSRDGASTRR